MRTFSREAWTEAQAQWTAGRFSDEWADVRHQAAMRGILYPPEGSRWDSWDDDEPSQRAILIRAIRETPELLEETIARSRSWSDVIGKLFIERDELRDEGWRRTRRDDDERDARPQSRQAMTSLQAIFERLRDSVAR